jgi:hypothetical protein
MRQVWEDFAVLRLTTGGDRSHLIFCNRCFRSPRWPFRNDPFETKDHISWPDILPVIQVIDHRSIKCPEIWEPTFSISQSSVDDLRDIHQRESNNIGAITSILDASENARVWWKNIPDCPACGLFRNLIEGGKRLKNLMSRWSVPAEIDLQIKYSEFVDISSQDTTWSTHAGTIIFVNIQPWWDRKGKMDHSSDLTTDFILRSNESSCTMHNGIYNSRYSLEHIAQDWTTDFGRHFLFDLNISFEVILVLRPSLGNRSFWDNSIACFFDIDRTESMRDVSFFEKQTEWLT